ncbi:MAG TPA: hypothetical protein PLW65_01175, partial [Pseudomonadota bacterium]|nr:hypothetical protein [Pseudomonadota bacterium]
MKQLQAHAKDPVYSIVLQRDMTYVFDSPGDYQYGPSAFPAVTGSLTIEGNGATLVRNNSARSFRLATILGPPSVPAKGQLILHNLTVGNFESRGGDGGDALASPDAPCGGGGAGLGGAFFVQGELQLLGVTLKENGAYGGDGSGGNRGPLGVNAASSGCGGGGGLGGPGGPGMPPSGAGGSFGGGGGGGFFTEATAGTGGGYPGPKLSAGGVFGSYLAMGGQGGAGLAGAPSQSLGGTATTGTGGGGGGASGLGGSGGAGYFTASVSG